MDLIYFMWYPLGLGFRETLFTDYRARSVRQNLFDEDEISSFGGIIGLLGP